LGFTELAFARAKNTPFSNVIPCQNFPENPPSEVESQILLKLGMQRLIPWGMHRKVLKMDYKKDYWYAPPGFFEIQH